MDLAGVRSVDNRDVGRRKDTGIRPRTAGGRAGLHSPRRWPSGKRLTTIGSYRRVRSWTRPGRRRGGCLERRCRRRTDGQRDTSPGNEQRLPCSPNERGRQWVDSTAASSRQQEPQSLETPHRPSTQLFATKSPTGRHAVGEDAEGKLEQRKQETKYRRRARCLGLLNLLTR